MDLTLRDVLTSPDTTALVRSATIAAVYTDGTVDLNFGGGRISKGCNVLASYSPALGDAVEALRRDVSSWLVLGATRTSNVTTVNLSRSWRMPYNVTAATPTAANPYTVSAASTKSWRQLDGWSRSDVYQGAYSTAYGYWYGCYFYGSSAFSALKGATCTRLRIRISREGAGGVAGAENQWIAPHAHASQPSGSPVWQAGAVNAGAVAWSGSVDLDLPVSWGQGLIDGTFKGLGHRYAGTADYSIANPKSADSLSGRLLIDWK